MNIINIAYPETTTILKGLHKYRTLCEELIGPRTINEGSNSRGSSNWDLCMKHYERFLGKPFDYKGGLFWLAIVGGEGWGVVGMSCDMMQDNAYEHLYVCVEDDTLAIQLKLM